MEHCIGLFTTDQPSPNDHQNDHSLLLQGNFPDFDNILFFEKKLEECKTPDFQEIFSNGYISQLDSKHISEMKNNKIKENNLLEEEENDEIKCDFDFEYFEDYLIQDEENEPNSEEIQQNSTKQDDFKQVFKVQYIEKPQKTTLINHPIKKNKRYQLALMKYKEKKLRRKSSQLQETIQIVAQNAKKDSDILLSELN